MTQEENTLPESVRAELASHREARDRYFAVRSRIPELAERMAHHRKAAEASRHEAEAADERWRQQFRERDGQLTKEVRAEKRKAVELRETADEHGALADELEPELELCKIDVYEARMEYLSARERAHRAYVDHQLRAAAAEVFGSTAGGRLLTLLDERTQILRRDTHNDYTARELAMASGDQYEESMRKKVDARRTQLIMDLMQSQGASSEAEEEVSQDPILSELAEAEAIPHEAIRGYESLLARQKAREQLQHELRREEPA